MVNSKLIECVEKELKFFESSPDEYVPRLLDNGETLLTAMIKAKKTDTARQLLEAENGVHFLTLKNSDEKLPLFMAIEDELLETVQDIVFEIPSVNIEDDNGKLLIEYLFTILNKKLEKKERNETENDQVKDLITIIKIMVLRGAMILDFIPTIPCRKVKFELKDYSTKQNFEYEIEEVDVQMCSCKVNPVECVTKCHHVFCLSCVNGFEECQVCYTEAPLNPLRIYQS